MTQTALLTLSAGMRDVSYLLASIGVVSLFTAGVAWWGILRRPSTAAATGRLAPDSLRANLAAIAIVTAFGLCAAAAVLAVVARIF